MADRDDRNAEDIQFDWNSDNIRHIWEQHGIRPEQAEQAVRDPNCIDADAYSTEYERREGIVGMTDGGLMLQVIFTERSGRLRVIEAKKAERRQERAYRNQR